MKTTKLTLLALTIAVGVLSSCKKKKEELPENPDGGASNVKSFTFTTTNSAWTQDGKNYSAIFSVEDINADVLAKGSVNVFRGDGTGSSWTAMPVTVDGLQYSHSILMHTVKILVSGMDNLGATNPGVQQFRVVVIKGSARHANPNVDWNNYSEVSNVFHLAD